MDAEKWKDFFHRTCSKNGGRKLLVLLGLLGVALIGFSTLFSGKTQGKEPEPASSSSAGEYRQELEQALARIVSAITGEESPEILVTLESGSRYVYAADEKTDSREEETESVEERETAHVILKDSEGAQYPLTVTEIEPEIKGVVIVSRCAGNPVIREKLIDAVRTALHVSSARVCVTDAG